ncbi:TPA: DUF3379 family protein [Vibrio harveyi]|nr:DUF3379 family protein [Vibrio harveyi]
MKILSDILLRKKVLKVLSISFITGLAFGQLHWENIPFQNANANLADVAMKRVTRDQEFVKNIKENVSIHEVNAKTLPFNYQFSENLPYDVRYLNHCGFGGEDALYLILQGDKGNISVFLTNVTSEEISSTNRGNKTTFTMPIEDSSIILVGETGENLNAVADKLKNIINPIS